MSSPVLRKMSKVVQSIEQGEGVGARVRRSIGRHELRNFDPFLMLDHFKVAAPAGFPDHPHRGFETVTYMFPDSKGKFEHEDFCGHRGIIGPGDLQWMTAGRGIMHAEMPYGEGVSEGLQLWVNLPKASKMCEPKYQELPKEKVPRVSRDGVTAIVIAGEALGTKSPVYTVNETHYVHFILDKSATITQPVPSGFSAFIYTFKGKGVVHSSGVDIVVEPYHCVTFEQSGEAISITASEEMEFVYLAGRPIGEPVVQHGPFVMTSQKEIMQAINDFQACEAGFEPAADWHSDIGN